MKYYFLAVLIITISPKINSQELLLERDVKLKTFLSKQKKESLLIVNNENEEIGMFLLDKNEIKSYLFDLNYVIKDSFATSRPKEKYRILLGYTSEKNNYSLIFSDENKTKFFSKSISIVDKKTSYEEIKIKGEMFLESINYNNKLYLITIKKMSSILKLYEFKGGEIVRKGEVDLTKYKFSKSSKSLQYLLFNNTAAIKEDVILNKIDNKNPNSIDLASYANKVYCYNNTIYITIDLYKEYTKVISINLDNFDSNVDDYSFAKVDCDYDLGVNSNSYLLENKIYQVTGCKNELYFSISDITNGTKIKEWNINKDEEIDFKNTPLIQLGNAFNKNKKYKELTETQQILRKIEASNIGVSVYKKNDNLEITIGGFKKMNTKEFMVAAVSAGAVMATGAIGNNNIIGPNNQYYYYNPTMYSFLNYSYSRSVYFKSLLNQDLENITGDLEDNAFDEIRKFLIDHKKEISAETIFKVNDYYVLGYYNKKEEKYYLLKFNG